MAKARTCRRCVWREHKVEPCCWCRRLHKGKKDDYFKEDEEVEKEYTQKELIQSLRGCQPGEALCESCICGDYVHGDCFKVLVGHAAETIEQLQQELIDERDRYDRLVSFELCEAKELGARKLRQREEEFRQEQQLQRGEARVWYSKELIDKLRAENQYLEDKCAALQEEHKSFEIMYDRVAAQLEIVHLIFGKGNECGNR